MESENSFRLPNKHDIVDKSSRRHSIIGLAGFEFRNLRRRKRKHIDEDNISIQSFDVDIKPKKSRKSLLRVSSLANLLSPNRPGKKGSLTLKRSVSSTSFKVPASPVLPPKHSLTPYKAPQPSPAKRRLSRTWSDMMMSNVGCAPTSLTHHDIKQQEALYELYQGEVDLIEDLKVIKKTYRDSMKKLQLLTDGELQQVFGPIDSLIPVHENLVNRLQNQRLPDGTTQEIGRQLVDWIPSLQIYVEFCANQVFGKALLDTKKNDPAVDDFLERCQESPFSRKLDLWSLIDGARGRFVKYPLLIKSVLKYTVLKDEAKQLEKAIQLAEDIIVQADKKAGEAKCRYFRARITYLYDDQRNPLLEESIALVCSGPLKNNKGSKMHVFLFDKLLVVTRLVTQSGQQCFQTYRQPIPVQDLVVDDLQDGEVRMGSFRSTFGQGQTSKNIFKVSFRDSSEGQAHTLVANDEHDKRQWMQCLQKVQNEQQKPMQEEKKRRKKST